MSDDRDWGPWVEHDGQPAPQLMGIFGEVLTADGRCKTGVFRNTLAPPPLTFSLFVWGSLGHHKYPYRIIRYRIRRPRALMELIDTVENLPSPARVEVMV